MIELLKKTSTVPVGSTVSRMGAPLARGMMSSPPGVAAAAAAAGRRWATVPAEETKARMVVEVLESEATAELRPHFAEARERMLAAGVSSHHANIHRQARSAHNPFSVSTPSTSRR